MRPRLKRAEKNTKIAWRALCSRVGSAGEPPPPPPPPGGDGMVGTDPSHSLSGSPWGVGIRLVWKGLSRQPRVSDMRDVDSLLLISLFSSSLVASLYPMASLNG